MTRTELLEILQNGENSGVEFKRDDIDTRDLAKEIIALANLQGGKVLLGVEDDGTVSGIQRSDLELWVMNVCCDLVRPEIIPYFEIIKDVGGGKSVAVVHVERGWTVHHLWQKNHRTYFIRVGTRSREASQEELARLFHQRGLFRLETRPVSGADFEALDLRRLKDYFGRIRKQSFPKDPEKPEDKATWLTDWHTLLENTELMAAGEALLS